MATPNKPFSQENLSDNMTELFTRLSLEGDPEENGRGVNLDAQEIEVVAPIVADVEFAVRHNLERVPYRFIVVLPYTQGQLYKDILGSVWTDTLFFLKCSVPSGHFRVLVY